MNEINKNIEENLRNALSKEEKLFAASWEFKQIFECFQKLVSRKGNKEEIINELRYYIVDFKQKILNHKKENVK